MDVTSVLNQLNSAQEQAVTSDKKHLLVLAGAGSGKTRVLVHRIAWKIQVDNVSPYGILAVTFTNKAAREMRERIDNLLGMSLRGMWVGTFHGLAHRLLKAHWRDAKLPENFQILDSDDQLRLVKRVMRAMDLDEQRWPPKQAQWWINSQKDEGLRAAHIQESGDPFMATMLRIYRQYEQLCEQLGVIDFAELLLRVLELWRNNPDVLGHYQQRFGHILVDEFQDTNAVQYAWLRLLAGTSSDVTAVGDDDQSIYGWRGAKVENILSFERDFANTETIKLEQNYRSTSNILKAANAVIAKNADRLGKNLWTESGEGEPIALYAAFNEHDEARYIADRLADWIAQGNQRDDAAILYRSNAQSRVLEAALLQAEIPYRIYGGQRFYERLEIKNALCYLRMMLNCHDDVAFERVVNTPPRGIGDRTVEQIRELSRSNGCSLWEAFSHHGQ
jgi:DNA helicase-2/ATP-dependent DNA helicase PcrA